MDNSRNKVATDEATRQGATACLGKDLSGQIEAVPRTPSSGGGPSMAVTAFLVEMMARLERLTRHLDECLAIPERPLHSGAEVSATRRSALAKAVRMNCESVPGMAAFGGAIRPAERGGGRPPHGATQSHAPRHPGA
jgi:hypothetical protein